MSFFPSKHKNRLSNVILHKLKNISSETSLSYRYITNKNTPYHNYLDGFQAATSFDDEFKNAKKIREAKWNKIQNN